MANTNDPRVDPSTDHTHKISDDVKSAFRGIRGAGDAIRGTAMGVVDSTAHSRDGEVRDRTLAEKGLDDMRNADQRFGQRREERHRVGPAAGSGGQQAVAGDVGGAADANADVGPAGASTNAGAAPGQEPLARQDTDQRVQAQHLQQHQQQHQLGHGTGARNV